VSKMAVKWYLEINMFEPKTGYIVALMLQLIDRILAIVFFYCTYCFAFCRVFTVF
jgi:hypothetical protein